MGFKRVGEPVSLIFTFLINFLLFLDSFTCGGMLKAQAYSQSLSSPRPYPAGGECVWRIEASQGQVISLNVSHKKSYFFLTSFL